MERTIRKNEQAELKIDKKEFQKMSMQSMKLETQGRNNTSKMQLKKHKQTGTQSEEISRWQPREIKILK